MISAELIKKIKIYAVASLLVPLIAVNSCLIIYKFLGNFQENIAKYPNINWNVEKIEHTNTEHDLISSNHETYTYTNCPKYKSRRYYINTDNQTLEDIQENEDLIINLWKNKKIKSIIYKRQKDLNDTCIKNHPFLYSVLKNLAH